uniref:Uncharacterized protein n=1 Tax=Arundo donax TaxID=35708 RepID=A0A0A9BG88_ARUDO
MTCVGIYPTCNKLMQTHQHIT